MKKITLSKLSLLIVQNYCIAFVSLLKSLGGIYNVVGSASGVPWSFIYLSLDWPGNAHPGVESSNSFYFPSSNYSSSCFTADSSFT